MSMGTIFCHFLNLRCVSFRAQRVKNPLGSIEAAENEILRVRVEFLAVSSSNRSESDFCENQELVSRMWSS